MIVVKDLIKKYSGRTVLDIPIMEIKKGECFGLVGNNGAGKTTLFRLILDIIKADSGSVIIDAENVTVSEKWKFNITSFLDESFLFDFLTPYEYFKFICELHKISDSVFEERLLLFKEFINDETFLKKKYIRELSKGNKQKTGIIGALLPQTDFVLLDEPFSNLDPSSQFKLINLLNYCKNNFKMTFLISSHDLNHITDVCERIVLLENGEVLKDIEKGEGTLSELRNYFAI